MRMGKDTIVMQKEFFEIEDIPAILWGESAEKVIIAVHGNKSDKADLPIQILAESVLRGGCQVLSFDLPEHGGRKNKDTLCKVQNCVEELHTIMAYAKLRWKHISLFANSIGAYFSLLAYYDEVLEKVWFLSPVVNMRRIIENMMAWFHITEEQLEQEKTIQTPIGQNLYWDYYCYVKEHPVCAWKTSTAILYGSEDEMCEKDTILKFANDFSCRVKIVQGAEHYFHTSEQLQILKTWLSEK